LETTSFESLFALAASGQHARMTRIILLPILALTACATAATSPGTTAPKAEGLASLQFISGSWRGAGERPGIILEEEWSDPLGGTMAGTFRVVAGGRAVFYELAAIEHSGQDVNLILRHFGPGLSPRGEALSLRLERVEGTEAAFIATGSADVRRIVYRREGDTLRVTLERDEGAQTFEFSARTRS